MADGSPRRSAWTRPEDVPLLTDQYFLKTKDVVRRFGDRRVTYAVFMRRPVISKWTPPA